MNPFRDALEGWTEEQWYKGDSFNEERTRFCLLGRLVMTGGVRTIALIQTVAGELFPDRQTTVRPYTHVFNDHPDTTFEDVVQVLEKAAVRWDEQQ